MKKAALDLQRQRCAVTRRPWLVQALLWTQQVSISHRPTHISEAHSEDMIAKIAAQLAAQYAAGGAKAFTPGGPLGNDQREAKDPEFVKDVEINDLRNRYMLTKGGSQAQVRPATDLAIFFFSLRLLRQACGRAC